MRRNFYRISWYRKCLRHQVKNRLAAEIEDNVDMKAHRQNVDDSSISVSKFDDIAISIFVTINPNIELVFA